MITVHPQLEGSTVLINHAYRDHRRRLERSVSPSAGSPVLERPCCQAAAWQGPCRDSEASLRTQFRLGARLSRLGVRLEGRELEAERPSPRGIAGPGLRDCEPGPLQARAKDTVIVLVAPNPASWKIVHASAWHRD